MTYLNKTGLSGVSQLTISTWVKVDQSALDDAFANGNPSWGGSRNKIPILTFGTTKLGGTMGGTGHVEGDFVGLLISTKSAGGNNIQIFASGGGPAWTGAVPYLANGGTWDGSVHPVTRLEPNPSGMSGTTLVRDSVTGDTLATLDWDFSGISVQGHSPISASWGNTNPFSGGLFYSYDITFDTPTIALSPSALYLDSGNGVNFLAAEDTNQRESPTQNFWTFSEFTNAFVTDVSWNYIFFTVDLSDSSAVNWAMVVNFADTSVHTDSFTFPSNPGLHSIGGEQFGIPITPQEANPDPNNGHFSVGLNAKMRFAYTQIWFNQYIESTDVNLANFAVIKGSVLVPPTNIMAAQNAFGPSDIYAYRDKNKGVQYQTGFTVVGAAPADYTPGPGQSATGQQLPKQNRDSLVQQGAKLSLYQHL